MPIAGAKERERFGCGKFIRRAIASARFEKGQRTIVGHEMVREKFLRRTESVGEQFPEPLPADLRARAIVTEDRSMRMLFFGLANGRRDFHPVTHGVNFAEGNSSLHHAERTGIHAKKHEAFGPATEAG